MEKYLKDEGHAVYEGKMKVALRAFLDRRAWDPKFAHSCPQLSQEVNKRYPFAEPDGRAPAPTEGAYLRTLSLGSGSSYSKSKSHLLGSWLPMQVGHHL